MKPRPLSPLPIHLADRALSWGFKKETFSLGGQQLYPWTQADLQCHALCNELRSLLKLALLFSFAVTRCLFVSSHRVRHESRDHDTSASTIRVNNLLQCSLLFSLSTLVLCSIFHQWLRLYQPRPHAPVEQAYALFKTRATTLHRWNIRRGLAILPLFLQMAVVLFLGALLEPLKILGRSCSTVVPVLGMMVFVRYIWGLTKVENTVDAVEP